jgi:diguanylate cyclase (GGDEF)-like protein/PAS domain S-box-containing protein
MEQSVKPEMESHFNLRGRLAAIVAVALAAMVLIATLGLVHERSSLMEDRTAKTRQLVESAYGVLLHYHTLQQHGELSELQAQRAAIETIRTMRYDGREYFWINDMQPRMVMHPMRPELEGHDLSNFRDASDTRLFVEFVDIVRKDGAGFVEYPWPKPGFSRPVPKISYVKGFAPWGWVIGSGIYIDDVNRIFWDRVRLKIGIITAAILLLGSLMALVTRRIEREIDGYATGLARANAALRQAATVFENTTEGVMIADDANRVVAVNRAFIEITGYGADELIGRTPEVLRSGRNDEALYRRIQEAIKENGHWQGELWDHRKNGEEYPAWLNVSIVKDDGGRVTHYVSVFSDITVLKESEARLDQLAHHDPLTGLPNRLLLNARAEHALARARRNEKQMAVLFLDLDHFKYINDTLGHPAGDLLLQHVAERLKKCVRDEDTISRLGGDEFTVVLEDLDDGGAASIVARKILAALSEKTALFGREVFVTCSIGISLYPRDGEDIVTLFKNADSALYRAKDQGRDTYQFYTEELTTLAVERLELEIDLRHALENGELLIHYQPQVNLRSGEITGMEALVRWQHPRRGLLMPADFIPLAEETGLIVPLGEWVLRTACFQAKAWLDAGLSTAPVAVNLSPRQFRQKDLVERVAEMLRESGLPPDHLELEITEGLVMFNVEASIALMDQLKDMGVRFSIDDFGTGYSSLSYLKRFPIDKIKIHQSFVQNIISNPEDAAISSAIISLTHSMKRKAIAEGVETDAQREFLRAHHCDEIQGYHFSKPGPADMIERLLRDMAGAGSSGEGTCIAK